MGVFGLRKNPLSKTPPRLPAPRVSAPAAPKPAVRSTQTRSASNVPNPTQAKTGSTAKPEVRAPSGGSMLATAGAAVGVSLIPSFLNGASSSGNTGRGLIGDLVSAGTSLGQAAIYGEAARSGVADLLKNPVNVAIIAAALGGVVLLVTRR